MITSGPGGPFPPIRPAGEVTPPTNSNAAKAPAALSGTQDDSQGSVRPATVQAVDPAAQSAASEALPQNETNARARAAKGLVEPARPAARMFAGETPSEATPAGPPPTFDLSILEKTRALDSLPPPMAAPPPDDAGARPTAASAEVPRDATADTAQTPPPDPEPQDTRPDPTLRGAPMKPEVPGETA